MKNIKKNFITTLIGLLFLTLVMGFKTLGGDATVAVIISHDNPIAFKDNLTLSVSEVKSYFLRKAKKRWPETDKNILPVDKKKNCIEKNIFYSKVLNMDMLEVENYFLEKQYQDGDKPPDKFNSDKEIIDFVGDEVGAIGYVNINSLTSEAKTKVKVVLLINN